MKSTTTSFFIVKTHSIRHFSNSMITVTLSRINRRLSILHWSKLYGESNTSNIPQIINCNYVCINKQQAASQFTEQIQLLWCSDVIIDLQKAWTNYVMVQILKHFYWSYSWNDSVNILLLLYSMNTVNEEQHESGCLLTHYGSFEKEGKSSFILIIKLHYR